MKNLQATIKHFYEGGKASAVHFRYALLGFDLLMLFYLIISSFFYGNPVVEVLDAVFGTILLFDFFARLVISRHILRFLFNPFTLADIVVVLSLLLPVAGENFAFLRVLRMFRILRSYHVVKHLAIDFPYVYQHRDIIISCTNLLVFIFIMTALVFETQVGQNPYITIIWTRFISLSPH